MYFTRVLYGMPFTTTPLMSWSSFGTVRWAAAVAASRATVERLKRYIMDALGPVTDGMGEVEEGPGALGLAALILACRLPLGLMVIGISVMLLQPCNRTSLPRWTSRAWFISSRRERILCVVVFFLITWFGFTWLAL